MSKEIYIDSSGNQIPVCGSPLGNTLYLTQAQFDALEQAGELIPLADYIITDATALEYTSEDILYQATSTATVFDKLYELTYRAGDKIYLAGSIYPGRLTGSSKAISFFIPIKKLKGSSIRGATINGDFTVYGGDGYVNITNDSTTGSWNVSVYDTGILAVYTLNTAISLTNSRAINVMFTTSSSATKYAEFTGA